MIELTTEQHEALHNGTQKDILDEDDTRLMEPLLAELDPEDWEDVSAYPEKP